MSPLSFISLLLLGAPGVHAFRATVRLGRFEMGPRYSMRSGLDHPPSETPVWSEPIVSRADAIRTVGAVVAGYLAVPFSVQPCAAVRSTEQLVGASNLEHTNGNDVHQGMARKAGAPRPIPPELA